MNLYDEKNSLEQRRNSLKIISITVSSILFPSIFFNSCGSSSSAHNHSEEETGGTIRIDTLYQKNGILLNQNNYQSIELIINKIQIQDSTGKWFDILTSKESIELIGEVMRQQLLEKNIPINSYKKIRIFFSEESKLRIDNKVFPIIIPQELKNNGIIINQEVNIEYHGQLALIEIQINVPEIVFYESKTSSYTITSTNMNVNNSFLDELKKKQKTISNKQKSVQLLMEEASNTKNISHELENIISTLNSLLSTKQKEFLSTSLNSKEKLLNIFASENIYNQNINELHIPIELQGIADIFLVVTENLQQTKNTFLKEKADVLPTIAHNFAEQSCLDSCRSEALFDYAKELLRIAGDLETSLGLAGWNPILAGACELGAAAAAVIASGVLVAQLVACNSSCDRIHTHCDDGSVVLGLASNCPTGSEGGN